MTQFNRGDFVTPNKHYESLRQVAIVTDSDDKFTEAVTVTTSRKGQLLSLNVSATYATADLTKLMPESEGQRRLADLLIEKFPEMDAAFQEYLGALATEPEPYPADAPLDAGLQAKEEND